MKVDQTPQGDFAGTQLLVHHGELKFDAPVPFSESGQVVLKRLSVYVGYFELHTQRRNLRA